PAAFGRIGQTLNHRTILAGLRSERKEFVPRETATLDRWEAFHVELPERTLPGDPHPPRIALGSGSLQPEPDEGRRTAENLRITETELPHGLDRPPVPRRIWRLTHDELALDPQQRCRALSRHRRRAEPAGGDEAGPASKSRIAAGVFGAHRPDLDPPPQAQRRDRLDEERRAPLHRVE